MIAALAKRWHGRSDHDSGRSGGGARRAGEPRRARAEVDAGVSEGGARAACRPSVHPRVARARQRAQACREPPGGPQGDPKTSGCRPAVRDVVDASVLVAATVDAGAEGSWAERVLAQGKDRKTSCRERV